VYANLSLLLRAQIEGWFKKPRVEGTKKRKIKEVLKKILVLHHHRRNLLFILCAAIPLKTALMITDGKSIFVRKTDENGMISIIRFRIKE